MQVYLKDILAGINLKKQRGLEVSIRNYIGAKSDAAVLDARSEPCGDL